MNWIIRIKQAYEGRTNQIDLAFDRFPSDQEVEELAKAAAAAHASLIFKTCEATAWIETNSGKVYAKHTWRATHEPNRSIPSLEKIA